MSIYRFSSDSPVEDITFRYANDRPPIALLSAGQVALGGFSLIRGALEAAGWGAVPVSVEDKDVLQVSGFGHEQQLVTFLQTHHLAHGAPQITPEAGDHPKRALGEWVQDSGIRTGGLMNLVGDITLLASGIMSGSGLTTAGGALYTAGGAVAARYGNVKTEHHLRHVMEKTAEFLQKQAGNLPESCGLHTLLKEKREGVLPHMENFFYRYPSEVMLGAYTLGAGAMLLAGIKQRNPWGVAYGVSSIAMKAASLLIPEKKATDKDKPADGPVGKFVGWVQEKPLRVFGFGSLITEVLLGLSALREYRKNPQQHSYVLKFITTGTYIIADVLFAVSNKNHANADGKFDADEQRRLEALTAETISCQPERMQPALVRQVAEFLAVQPEMKGSAAGIGESIMNQVAHQKHNPWTRRAMPALSLPLQRF